MSKKLVLPRKTFRLIAAYSRLPREGRIVLDRLMGYLAVIDGKRGITVKPKKKTNITAGIPQVQFLEHLLRQHFPGKPWSCDPSP
jgi:hypothetical protein